MVNKAVIKQWIEALRNGKYKQGRSLLHNITKVNGQEELHEYCCLGVLCELGVEQGIVNREVQINGRKEKAAYGSPSSRSSYVLPKPVQDWAGLESPDPLFAGIDATIWNDSEKLSFNEIADMIEKEYLLKENNGQK